MNIRHLRIFIEVADTGKMSTAAENLFISQPTVSQTIKELEEHYDVLLFERLCKKLYITNDGKKLLTYARNVVRKFDELEERMFKNSQCNQINIGSSITIGNTLLPSILSSLKKTNPNIETYSYVNNTRIIEEKLLNSELDIAIVEGRIKDTNLISIPAINDRLVLACSKDHPISKKDNIHLDDFNNLDFVMREKGSSIRENFENYMADNNVKINIAYESNCPGSIKNAIIYNEYLSIISLRLIEKEVKNGLIHVIHNPEYPWERCFNIVYHKNKYIDSAMEEFIEIVQNYKDTSILDDFPYSKIICKP